MKEQTNQQTVPHPVSPDKSRVRHSANELRVLVAKGWKNKKHLDTNLFSCKKQTIKQTKPPPLVVWNHGHCARGVKVHFGLEHSEMQLPARLRKWRVTSRVPLGWIPAISPRAHGKSVGGQVWIGDGRNRGKAASLVWLCCLTTRFYAPMASHRDYFLLFSSKPQESHREGKFHSLTFLWTLVCTHGRCKNNSFR